MFHDHILHAPRSVKRPPVPAPTTTSTITLYVAVHVLYDKEPHAAVATQVFWSLETAHRFVHKRQVESLHAFLRQASEYESDKYALYWHAGTNMFNHLAIEHDFHALMDMCERDSVQRDGTREMWRVFKHTRHCKVTLL